jgi:predicted acyltransferase
MTQPAVQPRQTDAIQPGTERLVALDAFRGAIIALMVLVNTPGDGRHVYGPLQHAQWHGWTITDVVFPSFLWIVGVSLTLSFAKRIAAGASKSQLFIQVLRRAAILYALGLFLYGFPTFDLSTWRILGVLQRIAVCYVIASAIYLTTSVRGQIIWIVGLLVSYWCLMTLVPVPGYGPGRLDVEGNLAHYVDRLVLGSHNYAETKTWDPEGIISTLPSIATALLGILCGHILRLQRSMSEKLNYMFVAGNLLITAGLICNVWLPINKKLWTSSFSLFMAGLDFVMFAICIWAIDVKGYRRFTRPFVIMGMNAIAIYMASEFFVELLDALHVKRPIYDTIFAPLASPINASLIFAVTYTLLMFAIAYALYRKRWFLRV